MKDSFQNNFKKMTFLDEVRKEQRRKGGRFVAANIWDPVKAKAFMKDTGPRLLADLTIQQGPSIDVITARDIMLRFGEMCRQQRRHNLTSEDYAEALGQIFFEYRENLDALGERKMKAAKLASATFHCGPIAKILCDEDPSLRGSPLLKSALENRPRDPRAYIEEKRSKMQVGASRPGFDFSETQRGGFIQDCAL